jgi:hypothetical protein
MSGKAKSETTKTNNKTDNNTNNINLSILATKLVGATLVSQTFEIGCYDLFSKSCLFDNIKGSKDKEFIYVINDRLFTDEQLVRKVLSADIAKYLTRIVMGETTEKEKTENVSYKWNDLAKEHILSHVQDGETVKEDKLREILLLMDCLDLKVQMVAFLDYYKQKFGQQSVMEFIAGMKSDRYKIISIYCK